MDTFRIALSGDFRKEDGSPTFPSFDLSPILDHSRAELVWVDPVDGVIPSDPLEDCDALILLMPRFAASSVPKSGRLAMVARFGVGYDNVDIPTCDANGIALVITPDGVRRPVAVSIITYVLALSQKLMIKDRLCREGPDGWAKRGAYMGEGLIGKTFGQLGIGNIGAEVFRLAAPFGMRLIAHDPYADADTAKTLGVELVSCEELFARGRFPVGQRAVEQRHPSLRECRAAGHDEAHGLRDQHRARPGRGSARALRCAVVRRAGRCGA